MTTDDQILDDLRRVLNAVETPPPESTTLAEAALDWRSLDIELAELVHDSAIDEPELLVRGGTDELRVLSFATGDVSIEVEYANGKLAGQVVPSEIVVVELHRDGNEPTAIVSTDEFGTFLIADVAPGPLSLVCRADDRRWCVRTSWTAV
jgi:hypothetical protein